MEKPKPESEREKRKQLLDMLRIEEAVVATKGYRGSTRPQKYYEPFKDSITCLNFSRETLEPCDECWLMEFVPRDHHERALPCHQIPMNQKGETVVTLTSRGNVDRLEQEVLRWLRDKIGQLERELGEEAGSSSRPTAV